MVSSTSTFRWLKLFGPTSAVLSMGFIVAAMFVWPWIDAAIRRVTHWDEASTYLGIVATLAARGFNCLGSIGSTLKTS